MNCLNILCWTCVIYSPFAGHICKHALINLKRSLKYSRKKFALYALKISITPERMRNL